MWKLHVISMRRGTCSGGAGGQSCIHPDGRTQQNVASWRHVIATKQIQQPAACSDDLLLEPASVSSESEARSSSCFPNVNVQLLPNISQVPR